MLAFVIFAGLATLGHRIPAPKLKRSFGIFLILVATYILFKSLL